MGALLLGRAGLGSRATLARRARKARARAFAGILVGLLIAAAGAALFWLGRERTTFMGDGTLYIEGLTAGTAPLGERAGRALPALPIEPAPRLARSRPHLRRRERRLRRGLPAAGLLRRAYRGIGPRWATPRLRSAGACRRHASLLRLRGDLPAPGGGGDALPRARLARARWSRLLLAGGGGGGAGAAPAHHRRLPVALAGLSCFGWDSAPRHGAPVRIPSSPAAPPVADSARRARRRGDPARGCGILREAWSPSTCAARCLSPARSASTFPTRCSAPVTSATSFRSSG